MVHGAGGCGRGVGVVWSRSWWVWSRSWCGVVAVQGTMRVKGLL